MIHKQAFLGYKEQKNKALEFADYNYVLFLDADEALDNNLELSIQQAKVEFKYSGYTMNRCTNYCGKFIRHGSWYPDKKLRLFDKRLAGWVGDLVHERVDFISPGNQSFHLKGDLLHYSYYNIEEHITRSKRYSNLSALEYFRKGRRTGWIKKLVNPAWTFISGYILKLGFLDGKEGFQIAKISANATYLKYKKLGEMWKENEK